MPIIQTSDDSKCMCNHIPQQSQSHQWVYQVKVQTGVQLLVPDSQENLTALLSAGVPDQCIVQTWVGSRHDACVNGLFI